MLKTKLEKSGTLPSITGKIANRTTSGPFFSAFPSPMSPASLEDIYEKPIQKQLVSHRKPQLPHEEAQFRK